MTSITIPAHPLLLDGWCGPGYVSWHCELFGAVLQNGHVYDEAGDIWIKLSEMTQESRDMITLDLRRPEVQSRVSRMMWGVDGAVVQVQSGRVALFAGGNLRVSSRDRALECLSSVAGLPEADRLPTALRLCWMRWLEVRGE